MNPLDQLADITTPGAVSIWPLAWGYWLAIALLLLIIVVSAILITGYLKRTKQKRYALAQLNNLDCDKPEYIFEAQLLLKQVCSAYFPEHRIKTMHTGAWQHFVLNVYAGKNSEQIKQAVSDINQHLYEAKSPAQRPEQKPEQSTTNQITDEQRQKHQQIKTALGDFIQTSLPANKATHDKLPSALDAFKSQYKQGFNTQEKTNKEETTDDKTELANV